jgi:predicted Fe-Mo cluster-binding NifX family protein
MKLCAAADSNTLNSTVAQRFSRCKYFLIIDTDTKEFTAVENQNRGLRDGAGVGAAGDVLGFNIQAVITQNIGPTAFNLLTDQKIDLFTVEAGTTVEEAIKKYKRGELTSIKKPTVGAYFQKIVSER